MSDTTDVHRLVRIVDGIADRELAVRFVRHELSRIGPDASAVLLAALGAAAGAHHPASSRLMLLASVALAGAEQGELRAAIADAALARGDFDTARRLGAAREERAPGDDVAAQVPDFGRGRPLTLGERKSLARRRDRQLLARVLRDPHPDVIRILLGNPAITESDVVRLCARRPIVPDVLREVAASARWMVRYGVRLALARNPYTPLDLALSIVPHLNAQDARELAASPELDERLREACARASEPRTVH